MNKKFKLNLINFKKKISFYINDNYIITFKIHKNVENF